jgi:hypothetical protein
MFHYPSLLFSSHFSSLPGAITHAGSWPTQEVASNHLYPWPCPSNFWLTASLHPPSLHPSIWGLVFPLAFCPPACPRWFSYTVDYKILLALGLYSDKTFQVPILKHRQVRLRFTLPRLILWVFVTSFFTGVGCQPAAQPPTWRTRVPLIVWAITFDLSGKGDPTSSKLPPA